MVVIIVSVWPFGLVTALPCVVLCAWTLLLTTNPRHTLRICCPRQLKAQMLEHVPFYRTTCIHTSWELSRVWDADPHTPQGSWPIANFATVKYSWPLVPTRKLPAATYGMSETNVHVNLLPQCLMLALCISERCCRERPEATPHLCPNDVISPALLSVLERKFCARRTRCVPPAKCL